MHCGVADHKGSKELGVWRAERRHGSVKQKKGDVNAAENDVNKCRSTGRSDRTRANEDSVA